MGPDRHLYDATGASTSSPARFAATIRVRPSRGPDRVGRVGPDGDDDLARADRRRGDDRALEDGVWLLSRTVRPSPTRGPPRSRCDDVALGGRRGGGGPISRRFGKPAPPRPAGRGGDRGDRAGSTEIVERSLESDECAPLAGSVQVKRVVGGGRPAPPRTVAGSPAVLRVRRIVVIVLAPDRGRCTVIVGRTVIAPLSRSGAPAFGFVPREDLPVEPASDASRPARKVRLTAPRASAVAVATGSPAGGSKRRWR